MIIFALKRTPRAEFRCHVCVKRRHVIASVGESAEQTRSSHSAVDDVITADEQTTFTCLVAFSCLGHSLQTPHRLSVMDEMEPENPNSLDKNQKRKRILDDKGKVFHLGLFFKPCLLVLFCEVMSVVKLGLC